MIKYLSLKEVKEICFTLVVNLMRFNEPIPEFETRFKGKLESILSLPTQFAFGQELYPSLEEKAACYLYFIIKDHPFMNGNKRLAIVTTDVFLSLNGNRLDPHWKEIYDFALHIAQNNTTEHKTQFLKVVHFIAKHTTFLPSQKT